MFLINVLDCDMACDGCTGDGPDMCINCADGYREKNNLCISMFSINDDWIRYIKILLLLIIIIIYKIIYFRFWPTGS